MNLKDKVVIVTSAVDISRKENIGYIINSTLEQFGTIDVLINN